VLGAKQDVSMEGETCLDDQWTIKQRMLALCWHSQDSETKCFAVPRYHLGPPALLRPIRKAIEAAVSMTAVQNSQVDSAGAIP